MFEHAAALGLLAGVALMQSLNARNQGRPVRIRAPIDTFLHGLAAAAAAAPLCLSAADSELAFPAIAFAAGFALDLDHPLFFRSISVEKCSSMPTRPPMHSLAAAAAAALLASAAGLPMAWAAGTAVASHVLFDATDKSGVPMLFPAARVVGNLPLPAYFLWLAAVYAGSTAIGMRI